MGITPKEIINNIDEFHYTIKGSDKKLDKQVENLHLFEPDNTIDNDIKDNACLISKLSTLNKYSALLQELITKQSISVILILIDTQDFKNIDSLDKAAKENNVTLVVITGSLSINQLFNIVLSVFTNQQRELQKLVKSDYLELLQLVKQNSGLSKIIEASADIIGNPIIITDESFKLLGYASSNKEVNDPVWGQIVEHGYCPFEIVKALKKEGFLQDLQKKETPLLLTRGEFSKFIRRVVTEININGEIKGYIAVLEYNRPFKQTDFDVINYITSIVGLELFKSDAISKAKDELWYQLLKDLIEGNIENEESALNRVQSLGWNLKDYTQIIVIKNNDNRRVGGEHFPPIQSLISKEFSGSQISFSSSKIVGLLTHNYEKLPSTSLDRLADYCEKHNLKVGIGNSYQKLLELNQSYQEAEKALIISDKLENDRVVNFYYSYVTYDMLSQINGEDYIPKELITLKEHDKKNGTDYITTLSTYLSTGLNLTNTAKNLFVHRNTVLYRIKRIQGILNIDLEDYPSRLQIELGLLLLDLQKNNI